MNELSNNTIHGLILILTISTSLSLSNSFILFSVLSFSILFPWIFWCELTGMWFHSKRNEKYCSWSFCMKNSTHLISIPLPSHLFLFTFHTIFTSLMNSVFIQFFFLHLLQSIPFLVSPFPFLFFLSFLLISFSVSFYLRFLPFIRCMHKLEDLGACRVQFVCILYFWVFQS